MPTYYRKKGRRYIPVAEYTPEMSDVLHHGLYVLNVHQNGRSLRRVDRPATDELLAAVEQFRAALRDAMHEANQMTPNPRDGIRFSPKEKAAYANLRRELGDDWPIVFRGASMSDLIDAAVNALRAKLDTPQAPPS